MRLVVVGKLIVVVGRIIIVVGKLINIVEASSMPAVEDSRLELCKKGHKE